jgi:hypothetical protein
MLRSLLHRLGNSLQLTIKYLRKQKYVLQWSPACYGRQPVEFRVSRFGLDSLAKYLLTSCLPIPFLPQNTATIYWRLVSLRGPGSSVGIATGYGLDGPGYRIPVGARFSAPVQTGPVAHPASCKMGTGSVPGVESGRGVTLTPHRVLVPRSKNRVRVIPLLSPRTFVAYKKGETYVVSLQGLMTAVPLSSQHRYRSNRTAMKTNKDILWASYPLF